MLIKETIHHGDYYNVREQSVAPTWQGLIDLLSESPYGRGRDKNLDAMVNLHRAHNRFVARLLADLLTAGKGQLGWARYEVVEK